MTAAIRHGVCGPEAMDNLERMVCSLPAHFAVCLAVLATLAGCTGGSDAATSKPGQERLAAGVGDAPKDAGSCAPGEHPLQLANRRPAYMRVTAGGSRGRKALVLVLHGAGGSARDGLWAFRGGWDAPGLVFVAPSARGATWSVVQGSDRDLDTVNQALARASTRCRVDRRRIGVGGFSDGATYALTLGLSNGDLFRSVMALSPGGVLVDEFVGKPRIFIAHGTLDDVLPLGRTSDVIVRELRDAGYQVTYRKFRGGHKAPKEISKAAIRWFLRS